MFECVCSDSKKKVFPKSSRPQVQTRRPAAEEVQSVELFWGWILIVFQYTAVAIGVRAETSSVLTRTHSSLDARMVHYSQPRKGSKGVVRTACIAFPVRLLSGMLLCLLCSRNLAQAHKRNAASHGYDVEWSEESTNARAPQHRRLQNTPQYSGIICSLDSIVYRVALDPTTGSYDISSSNWTNHTKGVRRTNATAANRTKWNHSYFSSNNVTFQPDFVDVRACWCTQYLNRPVEFCLADFDSCMVEAQTNPVSCFRDKTPDGFVRSFWPVLVFWFVSLGFAWFCSEPGRSARRYARRTFHCRRSAWCHPHQRTAVEDAAVNDLNLLLQNQPERAAYMYRLYVIRERRRHQREHDRWWYRLFPRPVIFTAPTPEAARTAEAAVATTHTHHSTTALDAWDVTILDPRLRHRLALKTKVFRCAADDVREDGGTEPHGPTTAAASESAASLDVSHPTWTVPTLPLARGDPENVTLDEMDDEMEHGTRCAICLIRLKDGDVIGDISCGHILHKDCLKDWLRRKNRCPLCQQSGIARLQQAPPRADPDH